MNFLQFASNNVKRNARSYSAYLLSSAFAVMIFFIYAMFYFHPGIEDSNLGRMAKMGMKGAEYVIFVVSFLFILYSISSFLKARKKEFGILTILGAEGRQINKLLLLENMLIGIVAIVLGIGFGLILSKLFLMFGAKVIDIDELPFYLPWNAIILTASVFFALFLVISVLSVGMVRKSKVLDLLQGTNKPKPEPKASVLLSLVCVALLGSAIYIAQTNLKPETLLAILVLGLIGLYLFYTQLSVMIIRLLKKNRSFFWRGTNLIWLSEMTYKMKDNARMFFLVTVVTTMACSSIGIVLTLKDQNDEMYKNDPFAMNYRAFGKEVADKDLQMIESTLHQEGIAYERIDTDIFGSSLKDVPDGYAAFLTLTDYNKLAKALGVEQLPAIQPGHGVLLKGGTNSKRTLPDQVQTEQGNKSFTIEKEEARNLRGMSQTLVIADEEFKALVQAAGSESRGLEKEIIYHVPAWNGQDVPDSKSKEVIVSKAVFNQMMSALDNGETNGYLSARAADYMGLKEATNLISFIGVFIAAIFSISTASFLHFRLFTDLQQDRVSYLALSKIGVSIKEMRKASTIQIAALFFIPLVISAILTFVGLLSVLSDMLSWKAILTPSLYGIGAFTIAQLVYFFFVRSRYLSQLKRVMV